MVKNRSNLCWRMVLTMWRPRHLFRSLMIRCFSNDDDSTTGTTTVLLLHVHVYVRVRVHAKGLSPSLYSIEQKTKLFTKPEISRGYPVLTEPVKTLNQTLCPPPWDFKETIIKQIRFGLALTPVCFLSTLWPRLSVQIYTKNVYFLITCWQK